MPCPLSLLLSFGLRCPGCLLRRPCCSSGGGNGGGSRAGSAEPLCCRSVAAAMPLCARLPFFCLFSCCSVSFFSLSLHSFFLSFYSFTSYTDPSRRACANALSLRLRGGHAKTGGRGPLPFPPTCVRRRRRLCTTRDATRALERLHAHSCLFSPPSLPLARTVKAALHPWETTLLHNVKNKKKKT